MTDQQKEQTQPTPPLMDIDHQVSDMRAAHKQLLRQQNKILREAVKLAQQQLLDIAEVVHDGLCQRLVAAKMHIEACRGHRREVPIAPMDPCSIAIAHLDAAIAEARRVMAQLESTTRQKRKL